MIEQTNVSTIEINKITGPHAIFDQLSIVIFLNAIIIVPIPHARFLKVYVCLHE